MARSLVARISCHAFFAPDTAPANTPPSTTTAEPLGGWYNNIIVTWTNQWGYLAGNWLYGFNGTPGGFDYWYAQTMPAASTNNYDSVVRIRSNRSVLLKWSDDAVYPDVDGIVILAGDTSLRLRFEHEKDIRLRLLPYPDAETDPEPPAALLGQFWIADITVKQVDRATGELIDTPLNVYESPAD